MKRTLFLSLFTLCSGYLSAAVRLPALVGDNMVLQRNATINLWGWADPGERVAVQFQGKSLTTKADEKGKWTLAWAPIPAGGPYELIVRGKNTITLQNILVGDVWLASGQSNMEWPLNNVNNAKEEVKSADYPQIRLFKVATDFDFQPKPELPETKWQVCSPKTVDTFSAVAFLFGRELYQRYHVPIGLVQSAVGGTPAEAWTSANGLKTFPDFTQRINGWTGKDLTAYRAYKVKKNAWFNAYGRVDRGRMPDGRSWADIDIDITDWGRLRQPGLWLSVKELKGYGGTVWFRKEFEVPAEAAGKAGELSLGRLIVSDSAFVNGQFVGTTRTDASDAKRNYPVPYKLLKAGRNLLVLRITGAGSSLGGMMGPADLLYAQIGEQKISLAGEWLYKPAPDIRDLPDEVRLEGFNVTTPQTPAVLFNAMIAPLIPFTIKGVIWYQGEGNADNLAEASQYYSLFPALIHDWRQQWGYTFPFLFVQLAGYRPNKPEPADYPWAHLREAQYKTLTLPNTGMATAIDLGDETNIHPRNKQDVAHRLALVAQQVAYQEKVVPTGPVYTSMRVDGNKIRLHFDPVGSGLWVNDKYGYIRGFAIAGADKTFVWAKAFQDGDDVVVYADTVNQPVAVRYDWSNTPDGNLYNRENLPAIPFRTDDW